MDSMLFLITSAPSSPNLASAFRFARLLQVQGHPVTVFLLQDAVLAGVADGGAVAEVVAQGATCYTLDEDLALRGFTGLKLAPGVQEAGYAELVELMMERHTRVLGAF